MKSFDDYIESQMKRQNIPAMSVLIFDNKDNLFQKCFGKVDADGPAMDDQYYYGKDSPVALNNFMKQYFTPGGKYYDDYENFYDFEPGTEFVYSTIGSALTAVLLERITGQDFNTYCKNNIFKPLNMTNTHWELSEINKKMIVRPYDEYLKPIEHYTFTDYPNGGLRTTAQDLFNLLSSYANNGVCEGYRVLWHLI